MRLLTLSVLMALCCSVSLARPSFMKELNMTDRLVSPGHTFATLRPGTAHSVARKSAPKDYPRRASAPFSWADAGSGYQPQAYTHPRVLSGPEWAESANFEEALAERAKELGSEDLNRLFPSYEPALFNDGRPRNPRGRSGLIGRGVLGKYGANFAADPIVFRIHKEADGAERLQMVSIQRRDNGKWAIPGGMVDHGEQVSQTLARELAEEALGKEVSPEQVKHWEEQLARIFASEGVEVYRGYVDDFRNTDQAWMETSAFYVLLNQHHSRRLKWDLTLVAGDDASDARWMNLSARELENMHANHADIVSRAVQLLEVNLQAKVFADGQLYR